MKYSFCKNIICNSYNLSQSDPMHPQKKEEAGLSRIQSGEQLNKLFEDEQNTNCYQCGRKSKQWAETKHAIFLCLNCSAVYRDSLKNVSIKNIGLDLWQQEEIDILKIGGNIKFKNFMQTYGLNQAEPKTKLRSIAAEYYRRSLIAQLTGKPIGEPPSVEEGKKPFVAEIPLAEMTSDQMLQQAKQRLSWVGSKTKQYGNKAYDKVHYKVTSGELKQDIKTTASKVGETVSTTAKSAWSFISKQIDEIKKPKVEAPKQANDL